MPGDFLIDDLAGCFSDTEFATTVWWSPPPGDQDPRQIGVLIDQPFEGVSAHTGEIESYGPVAWAKTADVADAGQGATIDDGNTIFTVRGVEPDGFGITKLILSED